MGVIYYRFKSLKEWVTLEIPEDSIHVNKLRVLIMEREGLRRAFLLLSDPFRGRLYDWYIPSRSQVIVVRTPKWL